jgi:pimeloyl-ACP methyl ester carboxylesterase
MQEKILNTNNKIQIAINHYHSPKRDSVIIICPGCFICKDAKPFLNMANDFFSHFDVITMNFRGHGKSSGLFTFTAKEHEDLSAVVKYAKEKYSKIGLIGFSLGAATAIIYTATHKDIQSLIAVSAPSDFDKIENHFLKKEAIIPFFEKFELGKTPAIRPGNILQKKPKPIDLIHKISPIPVLFITGSNDPIISPWHTDELYKKAHEPKAILKFQDGIHAEELYLKSRNKFLKECITWFENTINI